MVTYARTVRFRMAGLKDEFQRQAAKRRRTALDNVLAQLSPDERKDLIAVILDPEVPLVAISEVMRRRGVTLSVHTIRRARRGEIDCGD